MAIDRTRLPGLGPEPAFTFPTVSRRTLANGLRVWTVEHHAAPVVNSLLLLSIGASDDPGDRPGLAAITGDMLDEGCGDLGALDLHDALGRIGANLDTEVGVEATLLSLTMLERFADRGLQLLADMAMRPRLDPAEFARVRELRLNRLIQLRDMPSALAERAFTRLLYGDHPYGHLSIGTEASVRELSLDDIHAFHRRYGPAAATVIVVGAKPHAELHALVERAFGGWEPDHGAAARALPPVPSGPIAGERVLLVQRPGSAQSELRLGHIAAPRDTPDYHALLTLNMILGGQFVSRVNMKLREEKGYTYGVRTGFDFRRAAGPFALQASVQSEATADAIAESLAEIAAIRGSRPVTAEELMLGRAALTRGYPRNFETGEQIGRATAQLALYGLPDDYFSTFVPKVLALTPDDVTSAAATHLHPDRLQIVVVGDRDVIGSGLEAFGTLREVDAKAAPAVARPS